MDSKIIEVIESYNKYLEGLPKGCIAIAEQIRKNDIPQALQSILHFSEGASWLTTASDLLSKNNILVRFEVERVLEFLEEVNNGLSIQDYVLVADMFEYEIAPFFEETPYIVGVQS
ncbi:hypothetical protein [Lysinibacillus pakistanensis]|uniref:hypothetical protein n=1 Tax=Lysinibacillus pakistanensis TaxID=759811 RepID=UPI003D2B3415